jgi:hypothetical protein
MKNAQTMTFDIATFVPPRGWNQAVNHGVLIIQDRQRLLGREVFCQIYLFPSQPSNASPTANFQNEWDAKVAQILGFTGRPSAQPETNPEGWTSLTDHADVLSPGGPLRVILFTVTGFGRFASVVVYVSPNSYQPELTDFFNNLNFLASAGGPTTLGQPAWPTSPEAPSTPSPNSDSSAAGSLANYVYTIPNGWAQQESSDRIVLMSPQMGIERCALTMLPLRPSSRPLVEEALDTFREIFGIDPRAIFPNPPDRMAQGVSPQGWEYFLIKKLVGGQEGESRTNGTILLTARVDGQIAAIVGTSKDFMISACFGLRNPDAWPYFFYSLRFKNARPTGQEAATIRQQLVGRWVVATGTVGLQYTFQANGRFADTAATQYRTRVSNSEVLQTTTGFFGNGAYSFDGNMLVMERDDNKRFEYFFRLEQVSRDNGNSWADELCMLEPGSNGEVCYRKQ